MTCALAIVILLLTTAAATAYALYCEIRMSRMQQKVFSSDAIATARADRIQLLQMRIETMKDRGR